MEQHAVPQDITGFKFKLVGDMTLKQFGELAGGAILAYLFFSSPWNPILKWPMVFFFGGLGIALAFFPIEERPLDLWIANFIRAIYRPTLYVWKKNAKALVGNTEEMTTTIKPKKLIPAEPDEDLGLTAWPFEKGETEEKQKEVTGPQEEPEIIKIEPTIVEEPAWQTAPIMEPQSQTTPSLEEPWPQPTQMAVPATAPIGTEAPAVSVTPSPAPQPSGQQPQSPLSVEELQKLREEKLNELEMAKNKLQEATKVAREEAFKTRMDSGAVTVDQLAKLREEKIAKGDQVALDRISTGEARLNALAEDNKKLSAQIEEVRNKIFALGGGESVELNGELAALVAQKDQLSGQIKSLQDELATVRSAPLSPSSYQPKQRVNLGGNAGVRVVNSPSPRQETVSLTEVPNVINGMVLNEKRAPMEGVIVVIKDKAGNSIRALKTNKVGQFIVSTPLPNGTYYLELEKAGFSFATLEAILTGEIMAPLEIPAQTMAVS